MEVLDDFQSSKQGRSIDDILTNGYSLDAMKSISRGFNILGKDIGSYIGFFFLSLVISFVANAIPIVNWIAPLIISPALSAGYSYYLKGYLKDGTSDFSNFFNGFKTPQIWQLFLIHLLSQIIIGIIALVLILILCGSMILSHLDDLMSLSNPANIQRNQDIIEELFTGEFIAGFIVAFMVAVAVSMFWMLASQFVVFRDLTFWEAMEASRKIVMKKFLSFFGWAIVWGFILIIACIPCLLGLPFAIPAMMLSLYALYMQITEDEAVLNS
jgi:hypothetical protein